MHPCKHTCIDHRACTCTVPHEAAIIEHTRGKERDDVVEDEEDDDDDADADDAAGHTAAVGFGNGPS